MKEFDEKNATADELWDWCMIEYQSCNPVARGLLDHFFKKIHSALKIVPEDQTFLEIGCGAGESSRRIYEMIAPRHFEVSEYDARYVQKLKETDFPLKVVQESVYALDRPNGSFDCVIMLEVLEHLQDYEKALKEIFRVSRRHVILSVPHEPLWRIMNLLRGRYVSAWGNTPGHVNHWSVAGLSKLISRFGRVQKIYTPFPWIILLAEVNR